MRRKLLLAGLLLLFSVYLSVVIAETDYNHYTENFTSKLYCDPVNTTALWDTVAGELKLPPFELTLTGTYDTPNYARGVTIAGDYAYVADEGSGLQVINISDPTNPTLAGSYNTPGAAMCVDVAGDHAYVADWTAGIQVIDISDPTNPSLAGSYTSPYAYKFFAVDVEGDYAYVADYDYGLQVIDISDPTSPSLAGSYYTFGIGEFIAVSGDYAYIADYDNGLQVIDISDPTSPSLAGSYNTSGYAMGVAISGDYAYVGDLYPGLKVIDISDPTNPSLAGSINTPGNAYIVAISGDYAYVADWNGGLQVIDISDPTNPALMGGYDTPGDALGVAVSGNHAYVADASSGLQVIDIGDSVSPVLAGSYDTPGTVWNVAVAGDYAYLPIGGSSFWVIDISDPISPTFAGSCSPPGSAESVVLSGDYAYVAVSYAGLSVIDISDPTSPTPAGSCDTPGNAFCIAISGNYTYVADYDSGFQVVDISDPTSPSIAGSYDTPGYARGVALGGDYAYVADYSSDLQVIDISDPTSPAFAGSCTTPGDAWGIALAGDYVYMACGYAGLQVIDISDPTVPTLAGGYNTPGYACRVALTGDYACVADFDGGFQVIDISDPANPSPVGSYDALDRCYGLAVSGDYAYMADGGDGLQVIWIFQRLLDAADNMGQSVQINQSSDDILGVKLSSTQTDTIRWEVSANGGTDWQEVLPDASLNIMVVPGNDLRWRSTHVYCHPLVNPTCSNLVIDWLYPLLPIVTDIPNDQGKQVRVKWLRSTYDYAGSPTPITEYAIYRRIDDDLSASPALKEPENDGNLQQLEAGKSRPPLAYPPGDWHYLATVPANCEDIYATVVPTLADSTVAEGMYYTVFFVRARTSSPSVYFDSPPDSGYSVDNLAPAVPMGFTVAYNTGSGNELYWEECPDGDFIGFRIYRGESEDFEPDPGNLVHTTTGTDWLDTVEEGWRYNYKITAVDYAGNESDAASAETVTGDDTPAAPEAYALYQNVPNPFNPATMIRFDLPVRSHVRLAVYNVKGQLVRVILDRDIDAGSREAIWDGRDSRGRSVASGIYFYRLYTPTFTESRKMILLR